MTADEYLRREAILADIRREELEREARASVALDKGQTHSACGVGGCPHCHCHDCATGMMQERDDLRAALEIYGRHSARCRVQSLGACTCGLDVILTKKAGER